MPMRTHLHVSARTQARTQAGAHTQACIFFLDMLLGLFSSVTIQ